MIPFTARTARLTRNMELGCKKNIYGEVGRAGERANLWHSSLHRFTTNQYGLYTPVLNFYDQTKTFYSKRDSAKTNIIKLGSIIRGTIQMKHYFGMENNIYYKLDLTQKMQLYFHFIVYIILVYICRRAGNRLTERLYPRSKNSKSPIWILTQSEVKSKLHCDWWSVSLSVLVSRPGWGSWPDVPSCLKVIVLSLWGALSDERSGLSFVSHSR
jgi:hypothetical protein